VSPVSQLDIIVGKTLPYFLGMVAITAAIAAVVGGGLLSVGAVVPIAVLFLSATFVGAMFARSFKELTFVTVAISTSLTTYAFVPAIFASLGSIGLISPLTLVVRDLQNAPVAPHEFAFSTGPLVIVASILFVLGASVYREEDMFTQRPIHRKAMAALARHVSGRTLPPTGTLPSLSAVTRVGAMTMLSIPFVFVAELLAVAMLFALPVSLSLPLLIFAIVVIEEIAKSLHVYAGYSHGRLPDGLVAALLVGAASGVGFFIGEKGMLVVQLLGFSDLQQSQLAFGTSPLPGVPAPILLLMPLALHTVTAGLSALGARYGDRSYVIGLLSAIAVHAAYNLTIVEVSNVY
jgi:ABC-type Na+ efflux pump permease subunit